MNNNDNMIPEYLPMVTDPLGVTYEQMVEMTKYKRISKNNSQPSASKISKENLDVIFKMLDEGYMCSEIMQVVNCDYFTIKSIQLGHAYADEYNEYKLKKGGDYVSN